MDGTVAGARLHYFSSRPAPRIRSGRCAFSLPSPLHRVRFQHHLTFTFSDHHRITFWRGQIHLEITFCRVAMGETGKVNPR